MTYYFQISPTLTDCSLVDVCLPPVLEKGVDVLADSAAAFGVRYLLMKFNTF